MGICRRVFQAAVVTCAKVLRHKDISESKARRPPSLKHMSKERVINQVREVSGGQVL